MSLIVETGEGLANANSYASIAEANAYFLERNDAEWAALTDSAKGASLINATEFLDSTFADAYSGSKSTYEQALQWPRIDAISDRFDLASNIVPREIKIATYQMALRASRGKPLVADQSQRVKREKVDVLEIEYQDSSSPAEVYSYVNSILKPILSQAPSNGSFNQVRIVR